MSLYMNVLVDDGYEFDKGKVEESQRKKFLWLNFWLYKEFRVIKIIWFMFIEFWIPKKGVFK